MANIKWEPKRKNERYYQRQLQWLFNQAISAAIGKNFDTDFIENVISIVNSDIFSNFTNKFVDRMLNSTNRDVYKTWRDAVLGNTKGRLLYAARQKEIEESVYQYLKQLNDENVFYIKSQPIDIAQRIVELANQYTQEGKRPEEIRSILQKLYPNMTKVKSTLIARTEASKAANNLVQVRAQNMGLNWYIWKTAKDQRVRDSHKHMDNIIVNFNNPPSPEKLIGKKSQGEYNAGNFPNCRCYSSIIVNLDLIKFPHKVYYNGSIVNMTRSQFERIM